MTRPMARPPRRDEIKALVDYVMEDYNQASDDERRDVRGLVRQAGIAVIDNYITDGPGYAGRVMFVVWSGGEELHEVFTFSGDRIQKVIPDPGITTMTINPLVEIKGPDHGR